MRYLWIGQLLNLYGMALVKLSICAYIFMLNFSKGFRILIWVSVVVHIGLNFIFPTVILFGECTPYTKHWDILGTQPGSCWSTKPKVISGMMTIVFEPRYACSHESNRIYGRSNKHRNGSHLHLRPASLHLPRSAQQAYSLGCTYRFPSRSHVSHTYPSPNHQAYT